MAAPAYQAKTSTGEQYSTSFTPTVPTGTTSGDLLLACCWSASEPISTAPTGWTQALTINNGSGAYLRVYWKVSGASESSPTFSTSSDTYGAVSLYRISGADATSPIDVTGTASGTLDAPSVTTTGADRLVLHLFGTTSSSGSSITVPTGDTALDTPSNFYVGLSSGYTTQATAGATGTATFDDGSVTTDQITATIAIAPTVTWSGPAYQSVASQSPGFSNFYMSRPSGVLPGDLLLAIASSNDGYITNTGGDFSTLTSQVEAASGLYVRVFWRIADGQDRDASGSSSNDFAKFSAPGLHSRIDLLRISGARQVAPMFAAGIATLDSPGGSAIADTLILRYFGSSTGAGLGAPVVPSGTTEILTADDTVSGSAILTGIAYEQQETTGSYAAATWDDGGNTTDSVALTMRVVAMLPLSGISSATSLEVDLLNSYSGFLAAPSVDNYYATGNDRDLKESNGANGTVAVTTPAKVGSRAMRTYQTGGESGEYYLTTETTVPYSLSNEFTVCVWLKCVAGTTAAKTWLSLHGSAADTIRVEQAADATPANQPLKLRVGEESSPVFYVASDQRTAGTYDPTQYTFIAIRSYNGHLSLRVNSADWSNGSHVEDEVFESIRLCQITTDGQDWYGDELVVFDRALSDSEVDILYNSSNGSQYPWRLLPNVSLENTINTISPGPLTTIADSVSAEFNEYGVSPGTFTTTLDSIATECALFEQLPSAFYTVLPGISAPAAINPALPGLLTTSMDVLVAEFDELGIPNAPFITHVDVLSVVADEYLPSPGPLTTTPPAVSAEFDMHSPLDTVVYTIVPAAGIEASIGTPSPGPLTTSAPAVAAEFGIQQVHLPPFITTVGSVGIEANVSVASPGPLSTTLAAVSGEFRPFSPYMQALSEVYRVYIASETLTGNLGTAAQKLVDERTTSRYTGTLKDENGDTVLKSTLDACQLVVYDKKTKTVIRETRDAFDMVATNGTVTWLITPLETSLITDSIPVGQTEPHVATFEFAWDSQDVANHSLTFATTSGSQVVTVTHADHGLEIEDHVIFKDAPAVGGLEMDGVFVVVTVVNANSYTVKHVNTATATTSGSGTATVYRRPMATKHSVEFQVRKREIQ